MEMVRKNARRPADLRDREASALVSRGVQMRSFCLLRAS